MELTGKDALLGVSLDARRNVVEVSESNHNISHRLLAFFETLRSVTKGLEFLEALLYSLDVAYHS